MSCHQCRKPLDDAKFYVLNVAAMKTSDDGSSTMIEDGELPVAISADIAIHDHDLQEPNGAFLVDLLNDIPVRNVQAETLFCSKACLLSWFAAKVDALSDLS